MLKRALVPFKPPIFPEDEDKSRKAVYAHWISLAFFGAVFFFEVVIRFTRPSQALETADYILIGIGVVSAACWWLLRLGYVSFTSLLLVISVWTATNGIAVNLVR